MIPVLVHTVVNHQTPNLSPANYLDPLCPDRHMVNMCFNYFQHPTSMDRAIMPGSI